MVLASNGLIRCQRRYFRHISISGVCDLMTL